MVQGGREDRAWADGADSRSMLERLTEGLLDNPKAGNRAGQIENRIRVYTADFHRWVERERRWRRWVPVAAAGAGALQRRRTLEGRCSTRAMAIVRAFIRS